MLNVFLNPEAFENSTESAVIDNEFTLDFDSLIEELAEKLNVAQDTINADDLRFSANDDAFGIELFLEEETGILHPSYFEIVYDNSKLDWDRFEAFRYLQHNDPKFSIDEKTAFIEGEIRECEDKFFVECPNDDESSNAFIRCFAQKYAEYNEIDTKYTSPQSIFDASEFKHYYSHHNSYVFRD